MAVYEIARIQLRRGRTSEGIGVPQLASGEMAWAIDTQELFIGNGAISEGAPYIGNTRILTEKDLNQWGFFGETCINTTVAQWQSQTSYTKGDIVAYNISADGLETYTYTFLCVISHISNIFENDLSEEKWIRTPYVFSYKKTDVLTGPDANSPVIRCIEDRLSDRVTLSDFITINDIKSDDYGVALQRAINNLFDNSQEIHKATNDPSYRVVLELPAGEYKIDNTIKIPSYTTIIGSGIDKTIIKFTGIGPVFLLNDPTNLHPPHHVTIKNLSINITNDEIKNYTGIELNSVRDSTFENISITDNWEGVYNTDTINHKAIILNGFSDAITCEKNTFSNIKISGFSCGFYLTNGVKFNTFENNLISDVYYGYVLGEDNFSTNGPNHIIIDNNTFIGIHSHAVYIQSGFDNIISNCSLINVGNNTSGTEETVPIVPQVYFETPNNVYRDNQSNRTNWLSQISTNQIFIPEISGPSVTFSNYGTYTIPEQLSSTQEKTLILKLPLRTDELGNVGKIFNCCINYNYENQINVDFVRRGKLTIIADYDKLTTDYIQSVDEFDYLGLETDDDALKLRFYAKFIDVNGVEYQAENNMIIAGIGIFYFDSNDLATSPSGTLTYSYTINF